MTATDPIHMTLSEAAAAIRDGWHAAATGTEEPGQACIAMIPKQEGAPGNSL